MNMAIQYTGTNTEQVARHLERECWVLCSGDLAVKMEPCHICDHAKIETVPLGWFVANADPDDSGFIDIEIDPDSF